MRVHPSYSEIDTLISKPSTVIIDLARRFDSILPNDWEIYIRPFLNGEHPDLVLLKENLGIVFIEVSDWIPNEVKHATIELENEGKKKEKTIYYKENNIEIQLCNPIKKVISYKSNLQGLYIPELGESIEKNYKTRIVARCGLYFPFLDSQEIDSLFKDNKNIFIWNKDTSDRELKAIIPNENQLKNVSVNPNWINEMRYWLKPPFHKMEEGSKIILNEEQRRHVNSDPGKYQRLRGVVGSGKTLVIAERAANIASINKHVLIVHFNITLMHYIRYHLSRSRKAFSWGNIEITHFHNLCRLYLAENNFNWPSDISYVPKLIINCKKNGCNSKNRAYDAILIDEGQDFQREWYELLKLFLKPNGEILFVADNAQNIYERDLSWTGIGRWRSLEKCYRLPISLIKELNRFNEIFMETKNFVREDPNREVTLPGTYDPHLVWYDHQDYYEVKKKCLNSLEWLIKHQLQKLSDIVILVANHDIGKDMVYFLESKDLPCNHIFGDSKSGSRAKKFAFKMNENKLKVCTMHSFKGWEIPNVIILIPPEKVKLQYNLDSLLYVAISRAIENLIIHNVRDKYKKFGKNWSQTSEVEKYLSLQHN